MLKGVPPPVKARYFSSMSADQLREPAGARAPL